MLDVEGADDVDARGQQILHVLIALGVLAARDVGVGQFVHQGDFGPPGQDRLQVHLLEDDAAILHLAPGNDLQAFDEFGRFFRAHGSPPGPRRCRRPPSCRRWPSWSICQVLPTPAP